MDVVIKPLNPADVRSVIRLWVSAGLSYKPQGRDSEMELNTQIKNDPDICQGAFFKGKLVGTCLGTDDGRRGWINRLAVDPRFRRSGLARKLIEHVEEALRKRGRRIICANIESWNNESLDLFRKSGYVVHDDIYYLSKRDGPEI